MDTMASQPATKDNGHHEFASYAPLTQKSGQPRRRGTATFTYGISAADLQFHDIRYGTFLITMVACADGQLCHAPIPARYKEKVGKI